MTGRSVFLTGASAGIGQALARRLAAPGTALGLVARRLERLEALREELEARGARVWLYEADVREPEPMARAARQFAAAAGGISWAIANAGVSRGDDLLEGTTERMSEVMTTNVLGVIHTLAPVIPIMVRRQAGHLVTIGSIAGFRGLPGKGAYCASKAAVKMLMDAHRPVLRRHGIRVTTICPGWVESEMTADNPYPMPFLMGVDKAARLIVRAIERGRRTYVFPWQMRLALPLIRFAPEWLLPEGK